MFAAEALRQRIDQQCQTLMQPIQQQAGHADVFPTLLPAPARQRLHRGSDHHPLGFSGQMQQMVFQQYAQSIGQPGEVFVRQQGLGEARRECAQGVEQVQAFRRPRRRRLQAEVQGADQPALVHDAVQGLGDGHAVQIGFDDRLRAFLGQPPTQFHHIHRPAQLSCHQHHGAGDAAEFAQQRVQHRRRGLRGHQPWACDSDEQVAGFVQAQRQLFAHEQPGCRSAARRDQGVTGGHDCAEASATGAQPGDQRQ